MQKIIELKNRKAILVVLHDIGLLHFFDKIITLKKGKGEIISKEDVNCNILEQLYDVSFEEINYQKGKIYVPAMEKRKTTGV